METFSTAYSNASAAENLGFLQDFQNEITDEIDDHFGTPGGHFERENFGGFSNSKIDDGFENFGGNERFGFPNSKVNTGLENTKFSKLLQLEKAQDPQPFGGQRSEGLRQNREAPRQNRFQVENQRFSEPYYPTKAANIQKRQPTSLPEDTNYFVPTVLTTRPPIRYSEPLRYMNPLDDHHNPGDVEVFSGFDSPHYQDSQKQSQSTPYYHAQQSQNKNPAQYQQKYQSNPPSFPQTQNNNPTQYPQKYSSEPESRSMDEGYLFQKVQEQTQPKNAGFYDDPSFPEGFFEIPKISKNPKNKESFFESIERFSEDSEKKTFKEEFKDTRQLPQGLVKHC